MLTDTLIRSPAKRRAHAAPSVGARLMARERFRAGASGSRPAKPPRTCSPMKRRSSCCRRAAGRSRPATWNETVSRDGRVRRAAPTPCMCRPGTTFTATATDAARSDPGLDTGARRRRRALIGPDEDDGEQRGSGTYAREVHDVFVRDPHVRRLMVGETYNPPGPLEQLSAAQARRPRRRADPRRGLPLPHRPGARLRPSGALHGGWRVRSMHMVRDGDVVLLPYGYHPVSSPPGYRLYYLWAMAGAERRLALHEDPAHRWIHDA